LRLRVKVTSDNRKLYILIFLFVLMTDYKTCRHYAIPCPLEEDSGEGICPHSSSPSCFGWRAKVNREVPSEGNYSERFRTQGVRE
jgi:hypothetical protein